MADPDNVPPSPASKELESNPSSWLVLGRLAEQIQRIEDNLKKVQQPAKQGVGSHVIEILKVILGGWPAFGLIFLVLFYGPLREALSAIPDKVRSANEIGVVGISLKTTLATEARKQGLGNLSETVPALSPRAIEDLLRGSRTHNSVTSWSSTKDGRIARISLPTEAWIQRTEELEKLNFAVLSTDARGQVFSGAKQMRAELDRFKREHPGGTRNLSNSESVEWQLNTPMPEQDRVSFFWEATDLGRQAAALILCAEFL
jgi:hypothetical protein